MYYNDNNGYPASLATTTISSYMASVPTAPTPADDPCTEAQNSYTYAQTGSGSGYNIDFCLGASTGGLSAGQNCVTEAGISSGACS